MKKDNKELFRNALFFSVFCMVANELIIPICQVEEVVLDKILITIPIWIGTGFLFGYLMKKMRS